jgi:hypothetical protein
VTSLPIYTRETLKAYARGYLRQLGHRETGTQRHAVGKVLACHPNDSSYFVVRCQFRELKEHVTSAHGKRGKPGKLCVQVYARTVRTEYRVARISWDTHTITELSSHFDRPSADKTLRAAHQAAE